MDLDRKNKIKYLRTNLVKMERRTMGKPASAACSPTIFGKEILISGCSDSAKFALITRQNLLTPKPIQRGLAPSLVMPWYISNIGMV
jgi:hypothetical protein